MCFQSTIARKAGFPLHRLSAVALAAPFAAQQDPADFLLDDVSVEAGPAPPAGGGLMSFGVAAAGFAVRRIRASGRRTR